MDSKHGAMRRRLPPMVVGPSSRFSYQENKAWEEAWIPQVIDTIPSRLLITQATLEQDQNEASDLIVLKNNDYRIGVRIRRPEYFDRYGHEVTFRCELSSGAKTEWDKIRDGWGDLFFYCFPNIEQTKLRRWTIISLSALREILARPKYPRLKKERNHGKGGSFFHPLVVKQWAAMHSGFVAASNWL